MQTVDSASPGTNLRALYQTSAAVRPSGLSVRAWAAVAVCVAAVPFLRGISGTRVFYIRDLSLYFWGRYLWLRRTLLSGDWPLWDPYVGGGQSAVADALHQMFLLPVLLLRLLGNEVLGFNLWVAMPFPLAALGTWGFLSGRFSASASALGAIGFSVAGPIVATGNFPNMSWSVAALPWLLWAADRAIACPTPRRMAVLSLAVCFQALAGEPVTLFSSLALTLAFTVFVGSSSSGTALWPRVRFGVLAGAAVGLGLALSAIQLIPMAEAARIAERSSSVGQGLWSLHPVALIETVAFHLFGDYYKIQALSFAPWMQPLNTGREPFFFSLYLGVPLLTLSLFGLLAGGTPRWSRFWVYAGATALVGAFGGHTLIYPFLRSHLPLLDSFRFPVKYLVVVCMAVAAAAAAGWDALQRSDADDGSGSRSQSARVVAAGAAMLVALMAAAVAGASLYFTDATAHRAFAIAQSLGVHDPVAGAEFMLRVLPRLAAILMLMSLGSAALMFIGAGRRKEAAAARYLLFVFIAGDLLVHAWGINPTFDAAYLAEPAWLVQTKSDPQSRFYVGGKREGTLDAGDLDSSRAFRNPPGLQGSASRAALSGQALFYPSAWHGREMLTYDLPVLWPRTFQSTVERFQDSWREERDRFLDRTGVRYRILPVTHAAGHAPLQQIPYFLESFLYDWGEGVARRADIMTRVNIVPDLRQQLEALFQSGWDSRTTANIERQPAAAGNVGSPVEPFARVVDESSNRLIVEAGTSADGGYLLLLDSYSDDWHAAVDGESASIVRANGLFRAVRLAAGRHLVEFVYRPRAFLWGSFVSAVACGVMLLLMAWRPTWRLRLTAAPASATTRTHS